MKWNVDNSKGPALVGIYKGVRVRMTASPDQKRYQAHIGKQVVAERELKRDLVKDVKRFINQSY